MRNKSALFQSSLFCDQQDKESQMNQRQVKKLNKAAEEVLDRVCFRDEHGNFYTEIYADYRDELDATLLKKLCNAADPREAFYEWLDEAYLYSCWDHEVTTNRKDGRGRFTSAVTGKNHDRIHYHAHCPHHRFVRQSLPEDKNSCRKRA